MLKIDKIFIYFFIICLFISSFLLFLIQPIVAKMILPWFGGGSSVWITCMLFFQISLLGGYLYAYFFHKFLSTKYQLIFHSGFLIISIFSLPIAPSLHWRITENIDPGYFIIGLLFSTIGLPYSLLSATSPLLQSWYSLKNPKRIPYRFFALSNFASLSGLLSYPFLIEPNSTLHQQSVIWSTAYGIFVLFCVSICFLVSKNSLSHSINQIILDNNLINYDIPISQPHMNDKILWLTLSFCSSLLLLATTDHLSQNIASVPLLWILPLSLYLLSFTLCFDRKGWYNRKIYFWIVLITLTGMSYGLGKWGMDSNLKTVIGAYCIGLFFCCMFCHGELNARKPEPRYLTSFYLIIALGGALGSVFAVLIAPNIFSFYFELPIGFILCALLLLITNYHRKWWVANIICIALIIRLAIISGVYIHFFNTSKEIRISMRNFYGHQRVIEHNKNQKNELRILYHGTIAHGAQFTSADKRATPITYFGPTSGIGLAIKSLPETPRRIGVIGLGAGTLAAYARSGDTIKYYEINPQVVEIAQHEFFYISDCLGKIDIRMGDGRLLLDQEPPQQFDLLAADAFSGDSVPVHLLTVQAIQIYFKHLKPDGVLAMNVSNLYLDLAPVLEKIARELHKEIIVISGNEDNQNEIYGSEWILMTTNVNVLDSPTIKSAVTKIKPKMELRLWTDDYSNLFQALK